MKEKEEHQSTRTRPRRSSVPSEQLSDNPPALSTLNNIIHDDEEHDAEVFLNTYGLKPSTIPPFALLAGNFEQSTNTQRRFNLKRHEKKKEKYNKTHEQKQGAKNKENKKEDEVSKTRDANEPGATEPDAQLHWNRFMGSLTCVEPTMGNPSPAKLAKPYNKNLDEVANQEPCSSSGSSASSSDCDVESRIKVKAGDHLYSELLPGLSDRWRGEDRLKIMDSIPNVDDTYFKTTQEKNKFHRYVNELKTSFYSDSNYYNDWDLEKMEKEKKHVLEKNDIDENKMASSYQANNYYYRNSIDRMNSRNSVTGHPNYGNMEPKDLEKVYYKENSSKGGMNSSRNYHLSMLQKKENITEYFKQQYGRKKMKFLPSLEKILFQNRYVPLFCRMFIVVLCVIALSLAARIYTNSNISYYANDSSSSSTYKKYALGQQPSTIMAIVVNSIAVLFEVFVAVDEFKGEPLGLRDPLGKLRLILLDLLFIIFSSANLAIAFGSMFDDDWVCLGGAPSMNSSPKINYICRKQRTLSSFLFLILCTWVITFTISIVRVVSKVSSLQR